jgi:hypothetical protein
MTTKAGQPMRLRVEGVCYVLFAYDIGFSIDLDSAEQHVRDIKQRETIRRTRKAPSYFQYRPPPLRVTVQSAPVKLAGCATEPDIDFVIYDFGAVSAIYRIPLRGTLDSLQALALELYDNEQLLHDSLAGVERLLETIRPAVTKPGVADVVEDYVIFQVTRGEPPIDPGRAASEYAVPLAQILRAETAALSRQEIEDSLTCCISFGEEDLAIIDWNTALLVGSDMDDVLAVLEFANVELLEMRFLDDQLDSALSEAFAHFSLRRWARPWGLRSRTEVLQRMARLQVDGAILFEGVNNTLKLLGDPYLARVYRLAAQRFHLSDWDASILRKLKTVESIYDKISDQQSAFRMEVLEWIIILLIAVSIVVSIK